MAIVKKSKTIRMAEPTDQLLKKLCDKINDSESNVVKVALEDLAKKLKIKP